MSNKHIKIKHFKTLLLLEKRILPVVYDGKEFTDMVAYRCDLFKNAGYGKGDNIYSKSGMQKLKNAEGEEIDKEFSLKVGDLIYKSKTKASDGNVEFYIGNNKVVGWGHINKNYVTKKVFKQINNEFYSDYVEDNDVPYISIIRYKGGQKNVKK